MADCNIELITIGDEILLGQTVDTNAHWIARKLADNGFRLRWHTTVGDNDSDIKHALKRAWDRAGIILVTGGLGPTHDDITVELLAKFFKDELIRREDILENIKTRFANRGVQVPPGSEKMALFPSLAKPIPNSHGSAPGVHYNIDGNDLFAMPGVPVEMKGMMDEYILSIIASATKAIFKSIVIRTTGIGESNLSALIGDPAVFLPVTLAYLPSVEQGVTLRLSCSGLDTDVVNNQLDSAFQYVHSRIKEHIYALGEVKLEEKILQILRDRGQKLAVAESCTGGMVCDRIVSIPGSSDVFERGFITYSNAAKMDLLGVNLETLNGYGAVSEQTAQEMAEGARSKANTDYGISVTGIAGPAGGTAEKPVGLVYFGIADKTGTVIESHRFSGNRDTIRQRSANAALTLLWKRLIDKAK